jgi:hypothetical protein
MTDGAAGCDGRRTKTSKGGNRDGEACEVRQALSYVSLGRLHNFEATARLLLNGDLRFRATCDFNRLRVAKLHTQQLLRDEPLDNL